MRKFIRSFGAIIFFITGCVDTPTPKPSSTSGSTARTDLNSMRMVSSPLQAQASAAIPTQVTYEIISENIIPGIKKDIDVRLSERVSEDDLRSIAMKLKNADPSRYQRIFIGYYLPGMEVGAGGWATTHFNPNIEVRILGLTMDQEMVLTEPPNDTSREIIGVWLEKGLSLKVELRSFVRTASFSWKTNTKTAVAERGS